MQAFELAALEQTQGMEHALLQTRQELADKLMDEFNQTVIDVSDSVIERSKPNPRRRRKDFWDTAASQLLATRQHYEREALQSARTDAENLDAINNQLQQARQALVNHI
ncbi:hypothetical protein BGX27_000868, partial [Mortierella sp. AM989]